jgi:hypothetical protein
MRRSHEAPQESGAGTMHPLDTQGNPDSIKIESSQMTNALVMKKQRENDNNGDRNTEQPKQNTTTHGVTSCKYEHVFITATFEGGSIPMSFGRLAGHDK